MTTRIPYLIAILALIGGVFISILFGYNEDYFQNNIKEGLAKNENSDYFRLTNPLRKFPHSTSIAFYLFPLT